MTSFAEKIAGYSPKRLALLAMELKAKLDALEGARAEPLAIIGMACRFPGGADDPASYWRLLRDGVDAVTEVPPSRWTPEDTAAVDPGAAGQLGVRWGAFLDQVDGFDADFFDISPREARLMDPQQRVLLEVAWEALESAGQDTARLGGSRTGVFVGVYNNDYAVLQLGSRSSDANSVTGTINSVVAGRLSYLLDLQGPCLVVDTACSSSLVALHLACQSLRQGESSMALAAGVNLLLSPHASLMVARGQALAPDGRCKSFDARANGFVRGEGCGVVVLKRLSDALAAGDRVLALVRGSAVNQDGKSTGLTAPNVLAQQALLRQALADARLAPADVDHVEAHGTGTALGDPIEMEAIKAVYGRGRAEDRPCVVGAVKTNIGHLEAASGIAGVIKTVLALEHEAIPPLLHLRRPNPRLSLDGAPIALPTALRPWPARGEPRRAGVSSFGVSGTNAHVILEEPPAPAEPPPPPRSRAQILPLSARSPAALAALARRVAEHLAAAPDASLRDICFTAALRRTHHGHRLAVAGESPAALAERLRALAEGVGAGARSGAGARRRIVFVFPGQGSQWLGMGRQLLGEEPAFRAALTACSAAIQAESGVSVVGELAADAGSSRLHEIDVIQPALFAIEVALAALWRAWGIEPDAVVGHSMGEVAAAHVAGALSLEDAAAIICRRSRMLRRISGRGAMLAAELSLPAAREAIAGLEDRISIAVSNSPTATVLSGDAAALDRVKAALEARNVFCRFVKVDVASHSPEVEPLSGELVAALAAVRPRSASVPMLSTVTASPCDGAELDAAYWARNLREPVLFSAAVGRLLAGGHDVFVEMSPHPILLPAVERCLEHAGRSGLTLASMRRDEPERNALLESLGALYSAHHPVDFRRVFPDGGRAAQLPSYPWQRKRFWIEDAPSPPGQKADSATSLRGRPVQVARGLDGQLFELSLGQASLPWLGAHRLGGAAVLSAAAFVELALGAAAEASGAGPYALADVEIERALALPDTGRRAVQVHIAEGDEGARAFQVHSRAARERAWTLHARGRAQRAGAAPAGSIAIDAARARCAEHVRGAAIYEALGRSGVQYDEPLRTVAEVWRRPGEALGRAALGPELLAEAARYELHPALLDAALQTLSFALTEDVGGGSIFVPTRIDRIVVSAGSAGAVWTHATIEAASDPDERVGALAVLDEEGRVLVEARGVRLRRVAAGRIAAASGEAAEDDAAGRWLYDVAWQEAPSATAAPGPAPAGWIVFADRGGLGAAAAEAIARRGEACVTVSAGDAYRRLDARRFEVDPGRPEDFERLLREAQAALMPSTSPGRALYLWGLDAAAGDAAIAPGALAGALHLAQALARAPRGARLWIATRGAQVPGAQVPGVPAEAASPAQAPLWGFGRTAALELPEAWGGLVDLDASASPGEPERLLRAIDGGEGSGEDQLAIRGERLLVPRLVRGAMPPASRPLRFRADASYLITGGLGGLGLAVARWMVERGARHLLLLGRRGLDGGAGEAAARRRAAVASLRERGADVSVLAADVADRAQMAAILRAPPAERPPLRGVIHAASLMTERRLADMDLATLTAMLRPKALGAWVLHELTRDLGCELFVMFSSTSSLWGASGLAHYAAANAFLDALAHHRRAAGLPAVTLHWGTWDEIRGAREAVEGAPSQYGLLPMPAPQALEAMAAALEAGVSHKVVASVDWSVLKPLWEARRRRPFLEAIEARGAVLPPRAPPARGRLLERLAGLPAPRRFDALVQHLQRDVGRILGFPDTELPAPDRGFFQMGMSSLMTLELRDALGRELGRDLPASLAFDHPNVEALARHLARIVEAIPIPLAGDAAPAEERAKGAPSSPPGPEIAGRLARMEQLSDDEIERLLAEKLG
ncbi:SDR family NAD(P)-dependent oxidoreductase [Sorangium sp. So ce388]|uniref:type I polyketide synthase n=1 Tax=Sorangium sp. So ce388 TaxID=3133309 RepID=UPI003F5B6F97